MSRRARGVRVEEEDGKYRVLLMGNFSSSEPSKELLMCEEDFDSMMEQGNRLLENKNRSEVKT